MVGAKLLLLRLRPQLPLMVGALPKQKEEQWVHPWLRLSITTRWMEWSGGYNPKQV